MEHVLNIELFGQHHKFQTDLDSNQAREVADLLKNEVAKIVADHQSRSMDSSEPVILIQAALTIAQEHIALKKRYRDVMEDICFRSDDLIRLMDRRAI